MSRGRLVVRSGIVVAVCLGLLWACPFDQSLREYLSAQFWLPFAKRGASFEKPDVRRISVPFAGMGPAVGNSTLDKLRAAYQGGFLHTAPVQEAVKAAQADRSLTRRQREEVDLIDAKIDMWLQNTEAAEKKLQAFVRTARSADLLSEGRGWLAHIYYEAGNQTAAGKIYLDELNRDGSNLSRETLLDSLRMTYGYDGGDQLREHLDEYFDTPAHAAFAIQLTTNPHWNRDAERFRRRTGDADDYNRIMTLLGQHRDLLAAGSGSDALALLAMRTALRMGDPAAASRVAGGLPDDAALRDEPDFQWMLASARFLSRDFAGAEAPLQALFESSRAGASQKAAAAYGLCGVYEKTGNRIDQIRYALWLYTAGRSNQRYVTIPSDIADLSIYWAPSGWDLNLLLESEASVEELRAFVEQNPNLPDIRLVNYALAVRLSRENEYDEAARIYDRIQAIRRAPRLRQLAALYRETTRSDQSAGEKLEAQYRFAEFLAANPDRIYFNDSLWLGLQNYALVADRDIRLTRKERDSLIAAERSLRDKQEERWRAYLILHDIVRTAGQTPLGRDAALLAIRCLRGIATDRFGREAEIRKADFELTAWLRQQPLNSPRQPASAAAPQAAAQ